MTLLSVGSWALNGRWRPGAHISENVEANFQKDIIFINKPHISSLNKYILWKKNSENYILWLYSFLWKL